MMPTKPTTTANLQMDGDKPTPTPEEPTPAPPKDDPKPEPPKDNTPTIRLRWER